MTMLVFSALLAALCLSPSAGAETGVAWRVLDRNGEPLQALPSVEGFRYPVPLEQMSPWVPLATLAAEDHRFFSHPGVDWRAAARAAWQNAVHGRVVSGASTLTQQLVRNREPRPRTFGSKMLEAADALALERRASKREILADYLNLVAYGNRARGIEAASRLYFNKPSSQLSLAETAYLAAIPRAPGARNPYRKPGALRKDQREILSRMRALGWIDAETHALALEERVQVLSLEKQLPAPHFSEYLRQWILARGENSGAVRSTIDATLQRESAAILRFHIAKLAANRVGNGAILAVDNRSGEILVWVGSKDFRGEVDGQVDGVTAQRQPGSALKPFVYGLALENGRTPSDILLDEPFTALDRFSPKNYDEKFHGPVRLREALACSYNVPAIRVAEELGAAHVLEGLHQAGFDSLARSPDHYGLGLALGNGEVTLFELARAYSGLARGGVFRPLAFVRGSPEAGVPRRFLSPEAAYLITNILSDNAARTPAFGAYSPFNTPFPFAAKTGTTKDYRDNWAIGYTPDWTVAVWVGNFNGESMAKVSGISGAGPILRDVALLLWQRLGAREFPVPAGVRRVEVCPLSGLVPGPWCPTAMSEVFLAKRIPAAVCNLHKKNGGSSEFPIHAAGSAPRVAFPRNGEIFKIDASYARDAQKVKLRAENVENAGDLRWTVDGKALEDRDATGAAWWMLSPGDHRIQVSALRAAIWRRSPPVRVFVAGP